jgi:HK97 family phage portal protein
MVFGGTHTNVDSTLGENSLQSVAFHTACDLMASLVSELPFDVYSGKGPDRRYWPTPDHLLDPAGDGYGVEDWIYQLCMSWFLRGNALGDIVDQGPTGMLRQVDLWHPDRVNVRLEDGEPVWTVNGNVVPNRDVFHRRAFSVPGALMGLSPVEMHAATLDLNITVTRFGNTWFKDGATPSGILSNTEADMKDETAARTAKDRFLAAMFGNREPLVLGRGWKYEKIQVAPEESQFLQTYTGSAAEAARIMGAGVAEVLGYDTGSSMTYGNVVDRDLSLLKYAADRWFKRVERVLGMFLPKPRYVKFDRDAFLSTSVVQRWQTNQIKLSTGAYTIDEIRAQNNDKPVKWGKEPFAMPKAAGEEPKPEDGGPNNGGSNGGTE